MTSREEQALHLWVKLIKFVCRPRPLNRAAKKQAGLKHHRFAGYGHRWFRRQRVVDPEEAAIMVEIAELREARISWYRIAQTLLYKGIRTREGAEWSTSRIRRAHAAELRRREATLRR